MHHTNLKSSSTNHLKMDPLHETYHDPRNEAGFGSVRALAAAHKATHKQSQVKEFLLDQLTYSLHHPARRRFKRNPIVATSVGDVCQADLVDLNMFRGDNDGFCYVLTFIDVFSKLAFAEPLKNKTASSIKQAFEKIFQSFHPAQIQTDRGLEFKNNVVMTMMRKYSVNLYFTYNQDIKAAVVERFNRTIKARMFRFFTYTGSRRWIDVLDDLVHAYNRSYHRSIKMRPIDVVDADPRHVFRNLYGFNTEREMLLSDEPDEKKKLNIGDTVRIRYHIAPTEKGYLPNFTDATYTIKQIIKGAKRMMYKVVDYADQEYPRRLYAEDLLKVPPNPLYRIEKILRKRRSPRGPEVLVKFVNYPNSANQWIPESRIQNVN